MVDFLKNVSYDLLYIKCITILKHVQSLQANWDIKNNFYTSSQYIYSTIIWNFNIIFKAPVRRWKSQWYKVSPKWVDIIVHTVNTFYLESFLEVLIFYNCIDFGVHFSNINFATSQVEIYYWRGTMPVPSPDFWYWQGTGAISAWILAWC